MKHTRILALALSLAMSLSLMTGCQKSQPTPEVSSPAASTPETSTPDASSSDETLEIANVMMISGPTGVGAAYMMRDFPGEPLWNFSVVTDNSEIAAALNSGETDIAATATNAAANLYNKTDGKITMLALNTKGVLYILEKGDSIQKMSDLKGKSIYAPSNVKGGNPEHIFNYLLTENGVDPSEVTMEWLTPQEITAKMVSEDTGICLMPVPAATAVLLKDQEVRQALDLSAEWDKVSDSPLVMGGLVVRTQFLEEHPDVVDAFLKEYENSITYMNDPANLDSAAEMVAAQAITANAQIAAAAIPQCNLTFLSGEDMRQAAQDYYEVLYQINPDSIGGAMPYDDFYYIP